GHRALLQRAVEAGTDLAHFEGFAVAIALDDGRQLQFDGFQRAEPFTTGLAATPTSDRGAVFGDARIDHTGVGMLAERTIHGTPCVSKVSCRGHGSVATVPEKPGSAKQQAITQAAGGLPATQ